jgi:heme exporter protein D
MDAPEKDQASHDHRYVWFAVGLALVVLAFAAVSIAVVVSTAP